MGLDRDQQAGLQSNSTRSKWRSGRLSAVSEIDIEFAVMNPFTSQVSSHFAAATLHVTLLLCCIFQAGTYSNQISLLVIIARKLIAAILSQQACSRLSSSELVSVVEQYLQEGSAIEWSSMISRQNKQMVL